MARSILITGGCGFVGSNLIAALRRSGDDHITVLDNETTSRQEHIAEFDVAFVHGDICDRAVLADVVPGKDVVVHLAADTRVMDSIVDPRHNFEANVVGTFNLLDAMRRAGVKRIIAASTGGAILGEVEPPVHEDMVPYPISPYGASKLAGEGYCSAFAGAYGLSAASLRFSNVYGPRSFHKGSVVATFMRNIMRKQPIVIYGDGTQTRDYVYAGDIADGICRCMDSDVSGVFQLGTGVETSINELIALIREVVGDGYAIDVQNEPFREGEIRRSVCLIDKARNAFGYAPAMRLEEGIRATWEWFLENDAR